MLPTRDEIERAAYDRWLRRHRAHGYDRDDWIGTENELTYSLNYEPVVEYPFDPATPAILGGDAAKRCRFCERNSRHAVFSTPRPVVQGLPDHRLFSAQVCDECEADCRDPLASHCEQFWRALDRGAARDQAFPTNIELIAVFKSLVASAILIMPERELAYFTDTIEWLNNPDHEYDAGLFSGACCHVYHSPFDDERSWASLARRIDDDAPFPYMLLFISSGKHIVQLAVPLCIRDHDLDGRTAHLPIRSLVAGEGSHFRDTRPTVLRLVGPASRARGQARRDFVLK